MSTILSELERIPRATWRGSDPTKPPVIRPRDPPEVSSGNYSPVFDDGGFISPDSPRWFEALRAVGGRVKLGEASTGGSVSTGVDALAWYASFHNHSDRWGIYVPLSSLPIIDALCLSGLPRSRSQRWRLAWDILMAHEIVHFGVDYACAWFELLHHVSIRRVLTDRMESGVAKGVFPRRSSYLEIEESLANGNVLREVAAHEDSDTAEVLRHFIRGQPPGYRDGELAETDFGFASLAAETLRSYLTVWSSAWNIDPGNPGVDFSRLLPIDLQGRSACPVWVINDLESVGLPRDAVRLITSLKPIEETKSFKKDLAKLHPDHRRAWSRLKDVLASGVPSKADFKKWIDEGEWSIRVNDSIRAHLQQPDETGFAQPWLATGIGGHKKMGHG